MLTVDTLTDGDRAAISSALDRWLAAFNVANVDGLVRDAADDVMIFPPNQPGITGEVIRSAWVICGCQIRGTSLARRHRPSPGRPWRAEPRKAPELLLDRGD